MLFFIRSNDVYSDPRLMKYIHFIKSQNEDYRLIAWDRDGVITDKGNHYYLSKRAGFNVGGIKAILNRIIWMWFVLKTLVMKRTNKTILHACDLDAAFPAIIYKIFFNKRIKVIFDVFDWYSATLYNQGTLVLRFFSMMEKLCVKYADYIIICEAERIEQIPYPIAAEKLYVLPNIPYFSDSSFLHEDNVYKFNNKKITFSYVGGFTSERCLGEIIDIAEKGYINLSIAGFGNIEIQKRLETLKNSPYIKYWGKVDYQSGLTIMYNSDIVYAMYAKTNPNHIYAAPNKLYESMFLGKPIFSTKGTIVERKINNMRIGYTSGENINEIMNVINNLDIVDIKNKGKVAKEIWRNKYCTYTKLFLENCYSKILDI